MMIGEHHKMATKAWETKELAAVSAINYGYTESATGASIGPRFLRITDIQDDRVDWDNVPYCKIEKADLPKYRLATGDIVFARTGATAEGGFNATKLGALAIPVPPLPEQRRIAGLRGGVHAVPETYGKVMGMRSFRAAMAR